MKITTLRAAAAALAMAAAGHAGAGEVAGHDWKGYAAVGCVPATGAEQFSRQILGGRPVYMNMDGDWGDVFCPIVRDEPQGGVGRLFQVKVLFHNSNAAATGSCVLRAHDADGFTVGVIGALAPPGETTLSLGPLNPANSGSYSLQCRLPPPDAGTGQRSYLVNYRVDEMSP